MLGDLKSSRLMIIKGFLFLGLGLLAAGLLLARQPELETLVLLAVAVWGFCRCYYFAFYVIQHYVDDTYRFAGLTSFVAYLWRRLRSSRESELRGRDRES